MIAHGYFSASFIESPCGLQSINLLDDISHLHPIQIKGLRKQSYTTLFFEMRDRFTK